MSYFAGLINPNHIKAHYYKLAKDNHPDLGGSTETMKAINAEYESVLKNAHGTKTSDGFTYYYNQQKETAAMSAIHRILSLRLPGVEIKLIGTWVWLTGETKSHREAIKEPFLVGDQERKFEWYGRHNAWIFHSDKGKQRSSGKTLAQIEETYGSKTFSSTELS